MVCPPFIHLYQYGLEFTHYTAVAPLKIILSNYFSFKKGKSGMLGKLYPISPILFTAPNQAFSVAILFGSIIFRTAAIQFFVKHFLFLYELDFQFYDIAFQKFSATEHFTFQAA